MKSVGQQTRIQTAVTVKLREVVAMDDGLPSSLFLDQLFDISQEYGGKWNHGTVVGLASDHLGGSIHFLGDILQKRNILDEDFRELYGFRLTWSQTNIARGMQAAQ